MRIVNRRAIPGQAGTVEKKQYLEHKLCPNVGRVLGKFCHSALSRGMGAMLFGAALNARRRRQAKTIPAFIFREDRIAE
jgi:predicted trehalose synthase